ncbi:hypothetical protein SNOG_03757 [Parastagonospora nodorum SN15]|uniref:Uncharacterized protein n=1 Tax=Phaeosphaeria nodorum (strain SN15 / ATCC MYA-4574 / FGSC 10173) TaxID=321614 RepID=Q0UWV7_PHANO|nr:hypothetical protein SNOG_03757 [Parastagonospora nodorum SN15]EAT88962.1 hypothetical protein SNOG_03757 [Parastagonospora nodorum SN15]
MAEMGGKELEQEIRVAAANIASWLTKYKQSIVVDSSNWLMIITEAGYLR